MLHDPLFFIRTLNLGVWNTSEHKNDAEVINVLITKIRIPKGRCAGISTDGKNTLISGRDLLFDDDHNFLESINLRMPYETGVTDIYEYKEYMSGAKKAIFGSTRYRLTEKRCQEFFRDKSNFDIEV